jgi:hypothetical protein
MVVSNTYCVVFLFCFSSSLISVSLDCPFLIAPSVCSNVYFNAVFQCVLIVLSFFSTYSCIRVIFLIFEIKIFNLKGLISKTKNITFV